ncbi:uncharacterized protein LOC100828161 isoform X1 [Brachypodium distachyon]|uniref:uncharacterized protein LOC100828161 isoform X1 n=1 Tax=Brachypodium distachyon TaxID=15368 RepID=UPI000D0E247C|nr:uncharacterized protein LOC100828161 isoform X1 [Brachypodium distachyon]|eukprot:XP_024311931.1 uncharacterized protein LOC100828161 isoform X1 [Brachypodium distachyon]
MATSASRGRPRGRGSIFRSAHADMESSSTPRRGRSDVSVSRGRGSRGRSIAVPDDEIWNPKLFACQKPHVLQDIFSKFNNFKMLLMKDISFDGLAEMPKQQWNRQFSFFCLCQTDADGDPMEFEYLDGTRVPMYPSHVHEIIGVKSEGVHISVTDDDIPDEVVEEVCRALGVKELTISNVWRVVESVVDEHSTKREQEAFQIGVVILAFAFMLDCRDREPKMPTYLLPYLISVEKLKQVNFGRCVLDIIGIAARKVPKLKRSHYSTCTVGGCSIVSQQSTSKCVPQNQGV